MNDADLATGAAPPAEDGSTMPFSQPARSVSVDAEPLPQLPGYAIEGTLGRGAMGVVYRARDTRLKRAVALKMILAGPHAGVEQVRERGRPRPPGQHRAPCPALVLPLGMLGWPMSSALHRRYQTPRALQP